MNERIRELMLEAGYAAPELALRAQKLAYLIVMQSIDILNAPSAMKFNEATLSECSEYSQGWVNGRKLGIDNLKEHFGVEE